MAPEIGRRYLATIVRTELRTINQKIAVQITAETADGPVSLLIWITEAAIGMARAQLRACGFDLDSHDLYELHDAPEALAGNMIPVDIEEYNGKLQARIPTSDTPTQKAVSAMQTALRKAKKDGEPPIAAPKAGQVANDDIPF